MKIARNDEEVVVCGAFNLQETALILNPTPVAPAASPSARFRVR
jgi:hypothetical protein